MYLEVFAYFIMKTEFSFQSFFDNVDKDHLNV